MSRSRQRLCRRLVPCPVRAQLVKGIRDRVLVEAMQALEANDGIGSWQQAVETVEALRSPRFKEGKPRHE
jgi:hypothetical protein